VKPKQDSWIISKDSRPEVGKGPVAGNFSLLPTNFKSPTKAPLLITGKAVESDVRKREAKMAEKVDSSD
jgi:hypothetical protein